MRMVVEPRDNSLNFLKISSAESLRQRGILCRRALLPRDFALPCVITDRVELQVEVPGFKAQVFFTI